MSGEGVAGGSGLGAKKSFQGERCRGLVCGSIEGGIEDLQGRLLREKGL